MVSLNQKVVYPGHGVAQVVKIFERKISDNIITFCELKFFNKGMTVMVAVDKFEEVGIRSLSSSEDISEVFTSFILPAKRLRDQEFYSSNWNRRNKDYQNKLKSGSIKNITEVYLDLKSLSMQKELSFGEKTLLQKTEALLLEEISAVESLDEIAAMERLRFFCGNSRVFAQRQLV